MPNDTRDRILNAAEVRLLSVGPSGLVLGSVAEDAGVSKGGLLYHFSSKEALVAGLCERMLDRFDRTLADVRDADGVQTGAFLRAYLASTVSEDGRPADNSAQLMAGLLATLGRDSTHMEAIRDRFAKWHESLAHDGIDETTSVIVRLAADGLWLSALLGLPQLDADIGPRTVRALRELTAPNEQDPSHASQ